MKKLLFISVFILFIIISCNVTENEPASLTNIDIISPNGGEVFFSNDSSFIIKWSQKNIDKIDILYSIDYLNNWTVLAESIDANLGEFLCKVPNVIADSVRLRLRSSQNEKLYDDSDGFFSIKEDDPYGLGKVKIITPKDGETLTGADHYLITWSNGEIMETVDLHYSLDNGVNWSEIIVDKIIPSGSYDWLVPNKNAERAKIRLTAHAPNISREIESDGSFRILGRQRDSNALAYFPMKIGDIRIYNREIYTMAGSEERFEIVKKTVKKDTVINNKQYFKVNVETTKNGNWDSFLRVDSLSKNVYVFYEYLNAEKLILNLELLPNEIYEIDSEYYVTLTQQDTVLIFDRFIGRKVFSRRDIYGYTSHDFQLLENIGNYLDFYSAEGNYTKDILKGAVIDGIVYGDTTFAIQ